MSCNPINFGVLTTKSKIQIKFNFYCFELNDVEATLKNTYLKLQKFKVSII
jgi:hypothetical protein